MLATSTTATRVFFLLTGMWRDGSVILCDTWEVCHAISHSASTHLNSPWQMFLQCVHEKPLVRWPTVPQHGPARALLSFLGGTCVGISSLQFNSICLAIPADLLKSPISFAATVFDCESLIASPLSFFLPWQEQP